MIDTLYHFKGFGGCACVCRLRFFEAPTGETVIVATELLENEGTSITNMAEHLATQVCREFNIDPEQLLWIEHYTGLVDGPDERIPESFDLVSFDLSFTEDGQQCYRFTEPHWRHMPLAEVSFLTGGALPVVEIRRDK